MRTLEKVIENLQVELEKEIDTIEWYARQMKEKELLIIDLKHTINDLKETNNGMPRL